MRNIILFTLALGLGALSVTGQDEGDADLKARIEKLTEELEQRAARRAAPADGARVELRSYEISDLCSPVVDRSLVLATLTPSGYEAPEPDEREPSPPYEVDSIIELIRLTVFPESWDTIEGADIAPKNARLFVSTVPAVHERIAKMLAFLRSFVEVQIAVEVVAVPATEEEIAAHPRELPAALAQELLSREALGSARVVCFDGQQVVRRTGQSRSYVSDFKVRAAEGVVMGDPIRAEVFSGCSVEIRSILDRDANGVVLHLLLERTEAADRMRQLRTAHGDLDLPAMEVARLGTALWAPLDRTVVAAAGTRGDESCVWLVTARRVSARK